MTDTSWRLAASKRDRQSCFTLQELSSPSAEWHSGDAGRAANGMYADSCRGQTPAIGRHEPYHPSLFRACALGLLLVRATSLSESQKTTIELSREFVVMPHYACCQRVHLCAIWYHR